MLELQPMRTADADAGLGGPPQLVSHNALLRLKLAFLALGCINNIIYVVILSASIDIVSSLPTGVVLFANIAPSLLVKLGWPYLVKGRIRYTRRVLACTVVNFSGVLVVALSTSNALRLTGIAMASFASGLGEMTCLQLTTTFGDDYLARTAVGFFSSGTGLAGLAGALLWWMLRGLGVKAGLGITSIIPFGFAISYLFILPKRAELVSPASKAYAPVASSEDDADAEEAEALQSSPLLALTFPEKLSVARPLFLPFMLPLFGVYLAEYTINQGVSPNLLYPIPSPVDSPILSHLIKKLSDYYPLWQLVYQTFVFFARSSTVLFRVPPLSRRFIYIPTVLQCGLLLLTSLEASRGLLEALFGRWIIPTIFVCIACEGLFGGYSYVSTFSCLGQAEAEGATGPARSEEEMAARREFRIACVGFADTSGILAASLLSMWLEPTICRSQVDRGKLLCTQVSSR